MGCRGGGFWSFRREGLGLWVYGVGGEEKFITPKGMVFGEWCRVAGLAVLGIGCGCVGQMFWGQNTHDFASRDQRRLMSLQIGAN